MARVFSKLVSPHKARVVSLGGQNILRAELVTFILYKSVICVFGRKYMSQVARVFSKLASQFEARVVSLGRQNISGVPFNIKGRSCHI